MRPSPPRGGPSLVRGILLVAGLAAVGIFHVWTHTRVIAAGYALGELQLRQKALEADQARLVVEVATLRAAGRLDAVARKRLNMAPPAPGAVVAGRMGAVAAAGRAGTAGDEDSRRPAPAEPAAQRVALRQGRARPAAN